MKGRRRIYYELESSVCELKIGQTEVREVHRQLDKCLSLSIDEQEKLGPRVMDLAKLMLLYPIQLFGFPQKIIKLLRETSRDMNSKLRLYLTKALVSLARLKVVDIHETLALFVDLQTLGDQVLKKLAFDHVIRSIKRMNQKHKSKAKNQELQDILFSMLQQDDEGKAKRSLDILCELHKRKVWVDDRTANAICTACLHPSPRVMIGALSFLNYGNTEEDGHFSLLNHLKDAQEFAENLFERLKVRGKRYEIVLMILKVISRTVGLHSLVFQHFFQFLQIYLLPHQRDIITLFEIFVESFHEKVPASDVVPILTQIVCAFVHDSSRTEDTVRAVNVVREICIRKPSLMTEDWEQDRVLYRKWRSHQKAASVAAQSLITLFREVRPSLELLDDYDDGSDPEDYEKSKQFLKECYDSAGIKGKNAHKRKVTDQEDSSSSSDDDDDTERMYSIQTKAMAIYNRMKGDYGVPFGPTTVYEESDDEMRAKRKRMLSDLAGQKTDAAEEICTVTIPKRKLPHRMIR